MPAPTEGRPAQPGVPGVGARVTALRTGRGLSLSELARRAGVGKAKEAKEREATKPKE